MELVIPYLLIILGLPLEGQQDPQVEAVHVTLSLQECQQLRETMRAEAEGKLDAVQMVCMELPAPEEFERRFKEDR